MREGLLVLNSSFQYDTETYGEDVEETSQGDTVHDSRSGGRSRVLRTRAFRDTV